MISRRGFVAALAALPFVASAQQSDFDFYRNPDAPLNLSHFGYPVDQFYNLGKTAASASGAVLNLAFVRPVTFAHWWFACTFNGGSLELFDTWNNQSIATFTDPRPTPIASGVYVTAAINALVEAKKSAFVLVRGKGPVQLYSSTLSLVW